MKKNVFCLSYYPWKCSKMSKCGTSQYGLVGVVVFSQRLDLISEAFLDLNTSRVYPRRRSFQADARAVSSGGRAVGLGVSLEAGGGPGSADAGAPAGQGLPSQARR